MAAATFGLRRLRGVQRPALASSSRCPGEPVLLLDVGANTEARAQHLVQFAYLGAAFSAAVLGVERPRVALLSVGEEASKGTPEVVEAHADPRRPPSGIDFIGNVEGRDLPDGGGRRHRHRRVHRQRRPEDDGGHGEAGRRRGPRRRALKPGRRAGGLLLRPALGGAAGEMDPDTTGGAILLGLRGVAVVAHGSSGPEGIANAIRLAARAVEERAVERTAELLESGGRDRGARDSRRRRARP